MKKLAVAALAIFILCFGLSSAVSAATTSGDMFDAINEQKSSDHYDYDKGTLELENVKKTDVDDLDDVSTLQMAIAKYKTVRQGIFTISHEEAVFYDPDNDKAVASATAAQDKSARAYIEKNELKQTESIDLGFILSLLALLIIIPAILVFIWGRRHHSALEYKIENNLLEHTGSSNYK